MAESHPQARKEGLVVRELPEELLVYDTDTHEAHCLNETAAAVWHRCDGRTSVPKIAAELSAALGTEVDEDVVWLALEDLWKRNLLVGEPAPSDEATMSRSQVLRRTGLVAAAVAVPVVVSVAAPTAAHAATCLPAQSVCTPGGIPCCAPLVCLNGVCTLGV
jgi:Coenzyme PQQ synthesis protein D (PqqD)